MKENEKIEIMVQPIKKNVIFQCTEFSIEEFFKRIELIAISGQLVALNWAEGIVRAHARIAHLSSKFI